MALDRVRKRCRADAQALLATMGCRAIQIQTPLSIFFKIENH
jgi:hypothetical protein